VADPESTRVRRAVLVAFPVRGALVPYLGGRHARPLDSEEGIGVFDSLTRGLYVLESQCNPQPIRPTLEAVVVFVHRRMPNKPVEK
jgi:hypothetical protein